ncbi:MAG: hypothetical protein OEY59_03795, partial [Deltaproteobacteria bacterium]|nr:hypothetical protein [Deltaproteobacteria bacterium]
ILELRPDGFSFFKGGFLEYLEKQGRDHLDRNVDHRALEKKKNTKQRENQSTNKQSRENQKEANQLQKSIKNKEKKVADIELELEKLDQLLSTAFQSNPRNRKEIDRITQDKTYYEDQLKKTYQDWEKQQERLDMIYQG